MPDVVLSKLTEEVLEIGLSMAMPLSEEQGHRLAAYLDLIARWNPRVRLVGRAESDTLVGVHLADAIALAKAVQMHPTALSRPMHLLDVGTGAGLPGFALALILPLARITLCEISEKRVSFLYEAERRLGTGVEILAVRVETIVTTGRKFPQVVSRATFSPTEWRAMGGQLCVPKGLIWSLWTEEQERPFLEEELFRFRYRLSDGRLRVITAFQVP